MCRSAGVLQFDPANKEYFHLCIVKLSRTPSEGGSAGCSRPYLGKHCHQFFATCCCWWWSGRQHIDSMRLALCSSSLPQLLAPKHYTARPAVAAPPAVLGSSRSRVRCRATTDLAKFANQSYLDKAAKRFKLGEMHGKIHRSSCSCSACNSCNACPCGVVHTSSV
jgi:hypothetical protein